MATEIHGVQSIATGQFCTDCGVYLGKPSGHPEQCRKCRPAPRNGTTESIALAAQQVERDAANILKAMAIIAAVS